MERNQMENLDFLLEVNNIKEVAESIFQQLATG